MPTVFLHSALNINRSLAEMVKSHAREIEKKHNLKIDFIAQTCHRHQDGWLLEVEGIDRVPDMASSFAIDFARIGCNGIQQIFQPLPDRFPLREELNARGFTDPEGYVHPLFVVPYVIIANHRMVQESEIPRGWEDLLDPQWQGKLLLPGASLPLSKVVIAYMKYRFPARFNDFMLQAVFQGSPVDVKNAVENGQYPLGVVSVSFSSFGRGENTKVIWPAEGALCVPQVMLWRKGADERLYELGEYLRSYEMQKFFAQQGFIPAIPDVAIPPSAVANNCRLVWEGWDWFLDVIGKLKHFGDCSQ